MLSNVDEHGIVGERASEDNFGDMLPLLHHVLEIFKKIPYYICNLHLHLVDDSPSSANTLMPAKKQREITHFCETSNLNALCPCNFSLYILIHFSLSKSLGFCIGLEI